MPGVCPICVTYPHGDPNYVSYNLHGHLMMRHAYEMGEVIENEQSEEAMMKMAILDSLKTSGLQ